MKSLTMKFTLASIVLACAALTACGGGGGDDGTSTSSTGGSGSTAVQTLTPLTTAAYAWGGFIGDPKSNAQSVDIEVFDDNTYLGFYVDTVANPLGFGGVVAGQAQLINGTPQAWRSTKAVDYAFGPASNVSSVAISTDLPVGVGPNGAATLVGTYVRTAPDGTATTKQVQISSMTTGSGEKTVALDTLGGGYIGIVFDATSTLNQVRQNMVMTTDGKITGAYGACGFTGQFEVVPNRAVAKATLDFGNTCGALKSARAMLTKFTTNGGFTLVAAADDGTGAFIMSYERAL